MADIDFSKYDFFYTSDPYFSYELNYNRYDTNKCSRLTPTGIDTYTNKDCVIIWDEWYSEIETNCSLAVLEQDKMLKKIYELKNEDNTISIAIFALSN